MSERYQWSDAGDSESKGHRHSRRTLEETDRVDDVNASLVSLS